MTPFAAENTYVDIDSVDRADQRLPVRRVYCIGRNYADHAREMGHEPQREAPFFFMKPADAVGCEVREVPYPPRTAELHYEIELVVAIGRRGDNITSSSALDHVFGYAVGIDFTRRDLQKEAKSKGRPWETAKAFDHSAPISRLRLASDIGHPDSARIWLSVNDQVRQDANIADMLCNVADSIAELSTYFELQPGDLVFTGTPAGVGAVEPGDTLHGGIDGIGEIKLRIA